MIVLFCYLSRRFSDQQPSWLAGWSIGWLGAFELPDSFARREIAATPELRTGPSAFTGGS
jgi:hypothetical protein